MGPLGDTIIAEGWQAGADQHRLVRLCADFADTVEWAADGYSCPGRWIAAKLNMAKRTADEWIRVGKVLRDSPLLDAALAGKELSYAKAKVLSRCVTPDNEGELIEIARSVTAANLPRAIAAWLGDTESDEEIDRRQWGARSFRMWTEPDGMINGAFRLAPEQGAIVQAVLEATLMQQAARPRLVDEAWPSLAQQRADALVEGLSGGGGAPAVEVVLHVRGDGATLDDGSPITESAVGALLSESFVRLLIHDAEGRPINASSRRRHPTDRQKRVVKERDQVCVDCGSHDLLQYDHVPDYSITKHTVVEELQLRCSTCHRFRHAS